MVNKSVQKKLVKISGLAQKFDEKNGIDCSKYSTESNKIDKTNKDFRFKSKIRKQFKENLLLFFTVFSVVVGIILGFSIRTYAKFKPNHKQLFGFPGELFLRMLKFLILPLISSSLISGIASLGAHKASNIASKTFIYYFSTTFLAVILGIVLVILIKPGERLKIHTFSENLADPLNDRKISSIDTMLDLVR